MKYLILRAVLISIVFNFRYFLVYVQSEGFSPALFTDWDEPFYAVVVENAASVPFASIFSFKGGTLGVYEELNSRIPHEILDVILAKICQAAGLRAFELGLLLDLLLLPLLYIIFASAFSHLTQSRWLAELTAFAMLFLPYTISSFLSFFDFTFSFTGGLELSTVATHGAFPSLPFQRAFYTQVSYLPFALSVYCLFWYIQTGSRKAAFLIGCLGGLAIYCYFFTWASILALGFFTILFRSLQRSRNLAFAAIDLLIFACGALICSFPGLSALFAGGELYRPAYQEGMPSITDIINFSNYWYVSPPLILLAILLLLWRNSQIGEDIKLLAFALIASDLVLVNLQGVVNAWITPYHFPLFFLYPLLGALLFYRLFDFLKRFKNVLIILPLFYFSVAAFSKPWAPTGHINALRAISEHTEPGSVVGIIPLADSFDPSSNYVAYLMFPYWVASLTKADAFPLLLSYSPNREVLVRSELLVGWLYTGKMQLLKACPTPDSWPEFTDVIKGAQAFTKAMRLIDCKYADRILIDSTACDLLSGQRIDYLHFSPEFAELPADFVPAYSNLVWADSEGPHRLFRFDQAAALQAVCSPVAPVDTGPTSENR